LTSITVALICRSGDSYGQEVNLFKLGRMPAQVIVDKAGRARYVHYGHSMSDIPPNAELLGLLDRINQEGQETDV
jgi:peroxiredoxin Q/BCP